MNKVYITFVGKYDSYHPIAVFTTNGNAQMLADAHDGNVEEFDLDANLPMNVFLGCKLYNVQMDVNGDNAYAEVTEPTDVTDELDYVEPTKYHTTVYPGRYYMTTWARDEQEAIDKLNQKRLEYIAENEKK